MARLEFYVGAEASKYIVSLSDGAVPRTGEYINILGVTYLIERVTWAVDDAHKWNTSLRANIDIKKADIVS